MTTAIAPDQLEDAIDRKLDEDADEASVDSGTEEETTEAAEQEADATEEEKPLPKTIDELEHDHYEQICLLNVKVREAGVEYDDAKAESNRLKKRFENLGAQLSDLIEQDPRQRRLPFSDGSQDAEQPSSATTCEEWKKLSVTELGLAAGLVAKLEENSLATFGDLHDFWNARKDLKDLKGIGEEKSALVIDAFADYGATHPELFAEAGEEEDPLQYPGMTEEQFYCQSCDVLKLKKKHLNSLIGEGFDNPRQLASFWDSGNDLEGIGSIDSKGDVEIKKIFDAAFAEAGFGAEDQDESPAEDAAE